MKPQYPPTMNSQIQRFKVLNYLMESLGKDSQTKDMQMLANKIEEGNDKRTEYVLSYYEELLLIKLDENKRINDGNDIIKDAFG